MKYREEKRELNIRITDVSQQSSIHKKRKDGRSFGLKIEKRITEKTKVQENLNYYYI
jgi:hypothetical protein